MPVELPELIVPDATGWRAWLAEHADEAPGVWLVLAKKGVREPTSLTYDEALTDALCYGWIDGQLARRDETAYRQRCTPRRPRSPWSQRNVGLAQELIEQGRMTPRGLAEVQRAQADGRWAAAYAGSSEIVVPDDLAAALAGESRAQAMFDVLTRQNRFAVLYRMSQARRPETRARRIGEFVAMLAEGRTPYPQRKQAPTDRPG